MKFTSHRELHDGIVEATSKAYLFGFAAVTVTAHLKFEPIPDQQEQFNVLDLDQNEKIVGKAECNSENCRFSATVLNGSFTLSETWTPSAEGFVLSDGFQNFKGTPASYSGFFKLDNHN